LIAADAVIFDLDGTLVDNMGVHADAFARFAERHGLPPLTTALRARLDGKRNRDIFPILFERDLEPSELRAFGSEKEGLYRELSRGRLRPLRGLVAYLDRLDACAVPFAIATSAPLENVPHTLGEIGLLDRFPVVVRADEVERGKPHPDVFLETARRLGRSADRCLVFEDAPAGIAGARAAGMACIAIATTFPRAFLESDGGADRVVLDYEELARSGWAGPPG
jgi:HAD superfamily hydrolase (TIGR01509 family)